MDPLLLGAIVALATIVVLFSGVSVALGLLIVSAGFLIVFDGLRSLACRRRERDPKLNGGGEFLAVLIKHRVDLAQAPDTAQKCVGHALTHDGFKRLPSRRGLLDLARVVERGVAQIGHLGFALAQHLCEECLLFSGIVHRVDGCVVGFSISLVCRLGIHN